ncbi:hypothetical protein QCN27_12305 [Cereibacter sp. SYSU M97828]|nr:hypothetical protein [Cereibacter flavus]
MRFGLLTATLALVASAAFAQEDTGGDFSIGGGISTLGATLEPSLRLGDRWALRAPFGTGSIGLDDTSNGRDYSGDLDARGIGIMGDYYPFAASGFRLSAGVFLTDYSVDLKTDAVEFEGITSDVTARVRQRQNLMPALAVGYGGSVGRNGTISVTAGGLFGDGFDVSARESSGSVPQELVDAEIEDIRGDLGDLDIIPYLQLSVGFRF